MCLNDEPVGNVARLKGGLEKWITVKKTIFFIIFKQMFRKLYLLIFRRLKSNYDQDNPNKLVSNSGFKFTFIYFKP